MPLYFIDTSDQNRTFHDETGLQFPDLGSAKRAAIAALPDMARDELPDGDHRVFSTTVRDAEGRTLVEASLTLSVTTPGEAAR